MASFTSIGAIRFPVVVVAGFALSHAATAEPMLPIAELESRTLDRALEALDQNSKLARLQSGLKESEFPSRTGAETAARSTRAARIVNGLRTVAFPAVGSVLIGGKKSGARQWCSGTLIGSHHVLTAAHCVESDPRPTSYHVFFQNAGIFEVEQLFWQQDGYSPQSPNADVAVLRLSGPVRGIQPIRLNLERDPPTGTVGTIIGFGRSGGNRHDYGIKRIGSVRLSPCHRTGLSDTSDLICWEYAATSNVAGADSNTCNADSGGPFLWEFLPTRWLVAGVTSGGSRGDCLSVDHSYDVSVFAHGAWIRSVVGADLGAAVDVPPAVGDEGTIVLAADGELAKNPSPVHLLLSIPAGTREARITFNAEHDHVRDYSFEFSVSDVTGGASTRRLCEQSELDQFGGCGFFDPRPGTWRATLTPALGGGFFQAVATLFVSSGDSPPDR